MTSANTPWTNEEEQLLFSEYESGLSVKEMSKIHKCTEGAIKSRLKKLGLIEQF